MIQLRIQLSANESITANVMVRRVEEGRGMGVEFLAMNDADRNRLRKIVVGRLRLKYRTDSDRGVAGRTRDYDAGGCSQEDEGSEG